MTISPHHAGGLSLFTALSNKNNKTVGINPAEFCVHGFIGVNVPVLGLLVMSLETHRLANKDLLQWKCSITEMLICQISLKGR